MCKRLLVLSESDGQNSIMSTGSNEDQQPALREHLTLLAAAVSLVLWASAFVVIRFLGHGLQPGPLAFARLLTGTVVLTLLAVSRRPRRKLPRGSALGLVATYGVFWFAGYAVALNWAERHLDAGTASMLVQLAPLLVAVTAGFIFGEGFPQPMIVGLIVAFGGVVIISLGRHSGGTNDGTGVVLGLLAAVLYAVGVLVQKLALPRVDALTATWLGCTVGAVATAPFAGQAWTELGLASASEWLGVVFLGVGPTAIAFTTWAYALSRMPAGRLTVTTLVVPAIAIVMSWLTLGEVPTAVAIVGGCLCIIGVLFTRRNPQNLKRSAPAAAPILETPGSAGS